MGTWPTSSCYSIVLFSRPVQRSESMPLETHVAFHTGIVQAQTSCAQHVDNVCRASIINSIDAPAAPLELACLANAPAVLGVAGGSLDPPLHVCSVKHIPAADGQVSSLIPPLPCSSYQPWPTECPCPGLVCHAGVPTVEQNDTYSYFILYHY